MSFEFRDLIIKAVCIRRTIEEEEEEDKEDKKKKTFFILLFLSLFVSRSLVFFRPIFFSSAE